MNDMNHENALTQDAGTGEEHAVKLPLETREISVKQPVTNVVDADNTNTHQDTRISGAMLDELIENNPNEPDLTAHLPLSMEEEHFKGPTHASEPAEPQKLNPEPNSVQPSWSEMNFAEKIKAQMQKIKQTYPKDLK